jgi:hypothetical protein
MRMAEMREEEVNEQRIENLPREQRKESEMYYRAQFVRVVVNGLESIRWPPALEAFADPLVDLMNDKKTFLSAVNFVIKVGGLSGEREGPSTPKSRPSSVGASRQQQQQQQQHTPRGDGARPGWNSSPLSGNAEDGGYASPMGGGRGGSRGASRQQQREEQHPDFPSVGSLEISRISDASSSRLSGAQPPVMHHSALAGGAARVMHESAEALTTAAASSGGDDAATIRSLRASIEALQAHNTQLARQLKTSQEAAARREKAERSLELIIGDLTSAVGEVVSLTGGGGHNTTNMSSSLSSSAAAAAAAAASYMANPDPSFVTEEEDEAFQREVEREREELEDQQRDRKGLKVGGRGAGSYSVASSSSSASSRGGKHSSSTTSAAPRKAAIDGSNSNHNNKKVSSGLIWRQAFDRLQGLRAQWTEAVRDARSSFMQPMQTLRGEGRQYMKHRREGGGREPALLRAHRVLGVSRPLSFPYHSLEEGFDSNAPDAQDYLDTESGLWLDLSRVQQLQSDLLAFAEQANAFSKAMVVPKEHRSSHNNNTHKRAGKKGGRAAGGKKAAAPSRTGGKKGAVRSKQAGGVSNSVFGANVDPGASGTFSVSDSATFDASAAIGGGDSGDDSSSLSSYGGTASGPKAYSHNNNSGVNGGGGGGADLLLVRDEDRIRSRYLRRLQDTAADLCLHLAAFAPLAPLALHSPQSSSATGLECLLEEVNALIDPTSASGRHINKRTAQTVIEAGDRARSECAALVQTLDIRSSELDAWQELALSIQPVFTTFGQNATGILRRSWDDVSKCLAGLDDIVTALSAAEKCRVRVNDNGSSDGGGADTSNLSVATAATSGSKRGAPPLDALEKGYLGTEAAELASALRHHGPLLRDMQRCLYSTKTELHASAVRELSSLHAAKEQLRQKVYAQQQEQEEARRLGGAYNNDNNTGAQAGIPHIVFSRPPPPHVPSPSSAEKAAGSGRGGSAKKGGRPVSMDERPPFEL